LFVPEESVTNIAWSVNETLQSIVSGGIPAPSTIHFFEGLPSSYSSEHPIVDSHGATLQPATSRERGNPS
jgi:hypothetical protein